MISISRTGTFRRPVIFVWRWAFKFARNAEGRICNKFEAKLYKNTTDKRRALLLPIPWCSPGAHLLVIAAAS